LENRRRLDVDIFARCEKCGHDQIDHKPEGCTACQTEQAHHLVFLEVLPEVEVDKPNVEICREFVPL
jgi:hypothetical protein